MSTRTELSRRIGRQLSLATVGQSAKIIFLFLAMNIASASSVASQNLQIIGNGPFGPICAGPLGPGPCAQVQQWILTHPTLVVPLPPTQTFQAPPVLPSVYPAPSAGKFVPSQGSPPSTSFVPSPDGFRPNGPQQIAIACAQARGQNVAGFVECTGANVILPDRAHAVLECAVSSTTTNQFAKCAAPQIGINLTDDQRTLANCAMQSNGDQDDFVSCASSIVGNHLTPNQSAVLSCAQDSGDASEFASCAAKNIIGPQLSKEQRIAVECAADSGADYEQFATCAGTRYLNLGLNLNPEQQIAVECVVSTGGQPYAAGGCMVTRLTGRELEKCFQHGFGGSDGCFGDNNDLVGKNGWVARSFGEIAGGPNSVVHNPSQIFGGPNSVFNNPAQLAGGPNSMFNNPGQILGGNNSVFHNPGQLTGGPNSVINNPGQILGGNNSVFHCPFGGC